MKITIALMRDLESQVSKGEISYSRMVEILNEHSALPVPNTKTVEGDTLILEIAVDVEHELRRVMKENNRSVLDDHVQDIIHRNVTGIFDHNKSKYLRMLSSLRSNEPEKEPVFGRGYCAHCLKATKECSCYANPVSTTTETIQNPSPSLKALSEITDEHEN